MKLKYIVDPDALPKKIIEYGDREAMAYIAWQMPFAFACLERVFNDIRKRVPSFSPSSVLDFGTGPGTAFWYVLQKPI